MAASIKNSFVAFFVSILLSFTSGVHGENPTPSDIAFETCTYDDDGNLASAGTDADPTLVGNGLRTYEILCGKTDTGEFDEDDNNLYGPVSIDGSITFDILCELIDDTPDIKTYLAQDKTEHTIFAPTDAAFAKINGYIGLLTATEKQKFLQLHILDQPYLTADLICDEIYYTLNHDGMHYTQQRSKTKCGPSASSIFQIGGGNFEPYFPEIGNPIAVFDAGQFQNAATGDTFALRTTIATSVPPNAFSADAVGCNGVIQVVDNVLIPGTKSGKGEYEKGGKTKKSDKRQEPSPEPTQESMATEEPTPTPTGETAGEPSQEPRPTDDPKSTPKPHYVLTPHYVTPPPYGRELVYDNADHRIEDHEATENDGNDRVMAQENRRRRLEALLEPNGNIELLN